MKIRTCGLTMLVLLTAPLLCRGQNVLTIVAGAGNDPFVSGDGGPAMHKRY
jgi:hypothetical protein